MAASAASALRAFLRRSPGAHIRPRAQQCPWRNFSAAARNTAHAAPADGDDEATAAALHAAAPPPPPNDAEGIVLYQRDKLDTMFGLATVFSATSLVYFFNRAAADNPFAADHKVKLAKTSHNPQDLIDATAAAEEAAAALADRPWYESPYWSFGGLGAMGILLVGMNLIQKNTIAQLALVYEGNKPVLRVTPFDMMRVGRWSLKPGYVPVSAMKIAGENDKMWQIKPEGTTHKNTVAIIDKEKGVLPGRSAADNEAAMSKGVHMGLVDDLLADKGVTRRDLLDLCLAGRERELEQLLPAEVKKPDGGLAGQHWCKVVGGEKEYFFHTGTRRTRWDAPEGLDADTIPTRAG